MDDPPHVVRILSNLSQMGGGLYRAIFENVCQLAEVDYSWGLFRPSYWIYASTVYLLSPSTVLVLRFFMFILSLFLALNLISDGLFAGEKKRILFFALPFLGIKSFIDSVFLYSLQELPGIFFTVLGISFFQKGKKIQKYQFLFALLYFSVAALFKSPFVWSLLGAAGVSYFILRQRIQGLVFGATFFLIFITAFIFSQRGTYTKEIYGFDLGNIFQSILFFGKHSAPVFFMGMPLFFIPSLFKKERIFPVLKSVFMDPIVFLSFFTSFFYFITLLPRGVRSGYGYYFSPPLFFLCLGSLRCWAKEAEFTQPRFHSLLQLLGIFFALSFSGYQIYRGVARDYTVRAVRDWAMTLPQTGLRIGTNTNEVVMTMTDLLTLRSSAISGGTPARWINHSQVESAKDSRFDYYVAFREQVSPDPSCCSVIIKSLPFATIYQKGGY